MGAQIVDLGELRMLTGRIPPRCAQLFRTLLFHESSPQCLQLNRANHMQLRRLPSFAPAPFAARVASALAGDCARTRDLGYIAVHS